MSPWPSLCLASLFPAIIVLLVPLLIVLIHELRQRSIFRPRASGPSSRIPSTQLTRLSLFPGAAALQGEVDAAQRRAVTAKTRYERLGVIAVAVAPTLIWVSMLEPWLRAQDLSSPRGAAIARALLVLGLAFTLWLARRPTARHVRARLRTELLRFHLHALMVEVGPYAAFGPSPRIEELEDASRPTEKLLLEIRRLESRCQDQAVGPLPTAPTPMNEERARAYIIERVGEQKHYFQNTGARMGRSYSLSAWTTAIVIILAALSALAGALFPTGSAAAFLSASFVLLAGAAVLLAGLRAVFGWDAKAGLYTRQSDRLSKTVAALYKAAKEIGKGRPGASEEFRRQAARFESLMLREAADWALVSDHQFYEATP